jgi:chemotaxis protein histidine kinase CheA
MTLDLSAFKNEFRVEALENIETLDAELLALERNPADIGPIRKMFLAAHTIKGSSSMLGFAQVAVLAHGLEDVLAHLRDTDRALDGQGADLLFRAVDALRSLVQEAEVDDPASDLTAQLATDLRAWVAAGMVVPAPAAGPAVSVRPRALLVEDSPTVSLLETMLLEDAGFQVETAAGAEQVVALARAGGFAVVVAGCGWPDLLGVELAAALSGVDGPRAPVILMSSEATADLSQRAAAAGALALLRRGSLNCRRLSDAAGALLATSPVSADPLRPAAMITTQYVAGGETS